MTVTDTLARRLGVAALTLTLMAALLIGALVATANGAMRPPTADDPVCTSPVTVTPCAQGQLDAERTGRVMEPVTMHSDPGLAKRDRYIVAVVGTGTDVSYALRVKLLRAGYRVCEGLTARVPQTNIVRGLRTAYGFTSPEAWRVLSAATRVLCR